VPILRICAIIAVAVAAILVWAGYADLIQTIAWDIRHQRTASFRGQTLKVPWLWREEEWTNYNYFELLRTSSDPRETATVSVHYVDSSPEAVPRELENARKLAARLSGGTGGFYGDYTFDEFSKSQYVCVVTGSKWAPTRMIECYSLDGRWSIWMHGTKRSLSDAGTILRGVAAMGNPSK
jgi:hypothetical protein